MSLSRFFSRFVASSVLDARRAEAAKLVAADKAGVQFKTNVPPTAALYSHA